MAVHGVGKLIQARRAAWELYALWRAGMDPAVEWRRKRRLPQPSVEPWPSRVGAFIAACAREAATFEVVVSEVAIGFAKMQGGKSAGKGAGADEAMKRWESHRG